jgi:peptide/nickel transport system ATP-binding protein
VAERPALDVRDLTVSYRQQDGRLAAVRDFAMQIAPGQTYGLVGESGSGKSTVALAIMRYLNEDGRVESGAIDFNGQDLLPLSTAEMRDIWGRHISLVPQDPGAALNPSMRCGAQISEILRRHMGLDRAAAAARAVELLEMVRVPDPPRVAQSYPHQISGGMQQRVLIAMALSTEPELLILDEPTTGLDVTTQAAVLELFRELIRARDTAVLYVTHNLGVVAGICDRVAVLYAGELVEDAAVVDLFRGPLHPYTQGLLQSVPQIGRDKDDVVLQAIPGQIPALDERGGGCIFAPRCPLAIEKCFAERPPLDRSPAFSNLQPPPTPEPKSRTSSRDIKDTEGTEEAQRYTEERSPAFSNLQPPPTPEPKSRTSSHAVRCWRWPEIAAGEITAVQDERAPAAAGALGAGADVLAIEALHVTYQLGRSLGDVLARRPGPAVRAVAGVSLTVGDGQTLGIVGESGSGKTTLARAVVGLAPWSGGGMALLGLPLPPALEERPLDTLRRLQFIFQNPQEALNPTLTVGQTLRRPFITLLGLDGEAADAGVARLLTAVRLPPTYAAKLPGQLSGGEKQRVAIARAFAGSPDLLLADEAVSALDVSVQASILNLLRDLQAEEGNSLIFISHDLAVVGYLADVIAVMYAGRIMEMAAAGRLFEPPFHPYTEALLSAIPALDPTAVRRTIHLDGDVPSQIDVPPGCPFHPRCPRYLGDICREQTPPWRETPAGDRIFCHIPLDELQEAQTGGEE